MVTPRKPGAKRGRPPKGKDTPTPERSASAPKLGRKNITLRNDPDRYYIALSDALIMLGRANSENVVLLVIATLSVGEEAVLDPPSGKNGLIATTWTKRAASGMPATFEGRASTLREKRSKYQDPMSQLWRQAMARAFAFCLDENVASHDAKLAACVLAQSVGERDYAERAMLPMIDARQSSTELSSNS